MSTFPSDRSLRSALAPAPIDGPARAAVTVAIHEAVAVTRQRRSWLPWPWWVAPDATEPQRRRAFAFRYVAIAFALLTALLAGVLAAGALTHRPVLPAPITFIQDGKVLTIDPTTHAIAPAAALGGLNVGGITVSSSGRLVVEAADPRNFRRLTFHVYGADGRPGAVLQPPPGSILMGSEEWSPDGSQIVAVVSVAGFHRIALFNPASGVGELVGPAELAADEPSWSPDGRSIAYRAGSDGGTDTAIEILDPASGTARRVTGTLPGWIGTWSRPAWSPDGATLAFEVENTTGMAIGIWAVALGDGTVRRLTPPDLAGLQPMWSPDGRWLEFARFSRLGSSSCAADLFAMRSDGSRIRELVQNGWPAGWSPDGSWLMAEVAVKLGAPGEAGQGLPGAPYGGIVLIRPDGTDLTILTAYTRADAVSPASNGCGGLRSPGWQRVP